MPAGKSRMRQRRADELEVDSISDPRAEGSLDGLPKRLCAFPLHRLVFGRPSGQALPELKRLGRRQVRVHTVSARGGQGGVHDARDADDHYIACRIDGLAPVSKDAKVQRNVLRKLVGVQAQMQMHKRTRRFQRLREATPGLGTGRQQPCRVPNAGVAHHCVLRADAGASSKPHGLGNTIDDFNLLHMLAVPDFSTMLLDAANQRLDEGAHAAERIIQKSTLRVHVGQHVCHRSRGVSRSWQGLQHETDVVEPLP
mmetsp:Transcript_151015/g.485322  ORF Transcript_151015/g.485322 Transcript_151015/m.485322 type:complete len:255 (-) Transcript_151015:916-1680(-)